MTVPSLTAPTGAPSLRYAREKNMQDEEKQFFLYLYGKAGTGKTYLLNTLIAALEFKSLKSGVDLKNHWC